uniref:GIY-YIG nuclease family protein n=1 Tax=Oscillatoriales cyanobacterium SpSt-402 TaxID=2282168 RepID=A0A832H6W7_9CYAN
MSSEQRSLFSAAELQSARYAQPVEPLAISQNALQIWKQRVVQFQQQVTLNPPGEQGSLFGWTPSAEAIAEEVNPFTLPQQNVDFWRWQVEDAGVAAFYFVIDYEMPLLLYVGETVKSNQRWKGEHDCKRYIENYISTHRQCGEESTVGIAFLHWAPTETRPRQQLESALIYKWRSPFNKQNWTFWGTPFVGGK